MPLYTMKRTNLFLVQYMYTADRRLQETGDLNSQTKESKDNQLEKPDF